jgi:putative membrane protein
VSSKIQPPVDILVFCKGFLMGLADIIPGVSGGTIALITGIYERLVTAIGNISAEPLTHFLKGEKAEFSESFGRIDPAFLLVLLAGIGLGALIMSQLILGLLASFPAQTYAFFFGLILASSVLIYYRIERKRDLPALAWGAPGFATGILIGVANPASFGHSLPVLFLTGAVALCAMILPGISGAYITLLLNQYAYLLHAISSLDIVPLIAFSAGGVTGLLSFTHFLKYLLRTYHTQTLAFLTGLMLGSTIILYDLIRLSSGTITEVLVFIVVGTGLIVILELVLRRLEPPTSRG